VIANPSLRAERVPSEWEASASVSGDAGPAALSLSAAAYTGRVEGMIVWLPNFAGRWMPRNVDAARRGLDARAEANLPSARLRLSGAWSIARITWIRDGEDSGVQILYRPRSSGLFTARWAPGPWRAEVDARYTGLRYTSPSTANPLSGFWSADASLAREWRAGGWAATAALSVERLFNEKQTLIYGFPDPGRRARVDLRLRRAGPAEP
jgi:outer membrane cobalamin receptor